MYLLTTLSETKLLLNIQHENIVKLLQIFTSMLSLFAYNTNMFGGSGNNAYRGSTFIVIEYLEHDFEGLLWNWEKFTAS